MIFAISVKGVNFKDVTLPSHWPKSTDTDHVAVDVLELNAGRLETLQNVADGFLFYSDTIDS
jgi:hypothetical protein